MSEPPYGQPYQPYPPYQQRQPRPAQVRQQPAPGYGQPPRQMPVRRPDAETNSQVRAAYAARNELGPDYEDAIAAGLAERVEELVVHRTAELRHADAQAKEDRDDVRRGNTQRFVLGIVSLGSGIPITAIAGGFADLPGIIAAWAGIVGVNAVFAWGNRRKPRE